LTFDAAIAPQPMRRTTMTTFARNTAALLLAATLGGAAPALAQPVAEFDSPSVVGNWLHDGNGELVGSVYAVTDGGRTVIAQYGSYLTPGRHLVALPAADVTMVGGHAVLRTLTADALAGRPATN
jgi:hypothetical protein